MSFTAEDVRKLREATQAGMMDCKKALEATNGNYEEAVDYLRKKGLSTAASKAGRVAAEGAIGVCVDGNNASMVEVNAETDFVARNEDFQKVTSDIAKVACKGLHDFEALQAAHCEDGCTVLDAITNLVAKIKENIQLRRSVVMSIEPGVIASYVHNAYGPNLGKIGVLVAVKSSSTDTEKLNEIGRKVAMHIAAAKPRALVREDVKAEDLAREKAIYEDKARASGKPENVIEKMVEGSIRKFYEEVVLLEQPFVMEPKMTVKEFVASEAKELGSDVEISAFSMFVVGEGIEKNTTDFAAEVQALSQ